MEQCTIEMWSEGLPWWSSDWELAYQCRRHGFNTWSGRIPHVPGQLSPSTAAAKPRVTTTQAHVPRARAPQEKPLQWEAFTPQLESSPCSSTTTRKSLCSNEDPAQLKINLISVSKGNMLLTIPTQYSVFSIHWLRGGTDHLGWTLSPSTQKYFYQTQW